MMSGGFRAAGPLRAFLVLIGLLTYSAFASPALAGLDETSAEFNLPAQPLATALNSLALQANREMLFEDAAVEDRTAQSVIGRVEMSGSG
jgi:hypothetical protein